MTEFPFELVIGFDDQTGELLKKGKMRMATAADEVLPLKDPRVQANPEFHWFIRLSRVITELGHFEGSQVTNQTIEQLNLPDYNFLKNMYNRINRMGHNHAEGICPWCEKPVKLDLSEQGES